MPLSQGFLLLCAILFGGSAASPTPGLSPGPSQPPDASASFWAPHLSSAPNLSPPSRTPNSSLSTDPAGSPAPTGVPVPDAAATAPGSPAPLLPHGSEVSLLPPSAPQAPTAASDPHFNSPSTVEAPQTFAEGRGVTPSFIPIYTSFIGPDTVSLGTPLTETPATKSPGHLCNCSTVGSESEYDCNRTTGHCLCYPGYTGLQCRDCDGGFYRNLTSDICLPCDCNVTGAANPVCDSSGKCECKPGVTGLKCVHCQDGYYGFDTFGCSQCQCNNHSENCDLLTGKCVGCKDNTIGDHCEECETSFYRSQNVSLSEKCSQCPCSKALSNGSCHQKSGAVICDRCKTGYVGPHCEKCDNGYYMRDTVCMKCDCNGNVNPLTTPSICDPATGACLNCTNNTTGRKCELCKEGYIGQASARNCTKREVPAVTESREYTTGINTLKPTIFSTSVVNSTSSPVTVQTTFSVISSDNATSAVADVSWTQFNIIVLTVILIVVVLLVGFVGAVYMYREYQNRKLNAPFWTIELKEDNISFSSYHDTLPNADVSGLLEDDGNEITPNGQLSLTTPIHNFKT
ncbi:hypothetical protein NDU88_011663 [Pleurodeles waltl]|uniref:Laminin EGF-like domain-containing protein n=1 Tax=Pleurodeles waltl TaxID=8319 RepID=A0AAV7R207_PLEWA|nr:hypothetical protein NDU88_011663 [Pleurodeles waltl]